MILVPSLGDLPIALPSLDQHLGYVGLAVSDDERANAHATHRVDLCPYTPQILPELRPASGIWGWCERRRDFRASRMCGIQSITCTPPSPPFVASRTCPRRSRRTAAVSATVGLHGEPCCVGTEKHREGQYSCSRYPHNTWAMCDRIGL